MTHGLHPLTKARVWELVTPHGDQTHVIVSCDACPATDRLNCKVSHPPHLIANKLRKRGWAITGEGKKARCPLCAKPRRAVCSTPVLTQRDATQMLDAVKEAEQIVLETIIDEEKASPTIVPDPEGSQLYRDALEQLQIALRTHTMREVHGATNVSYGTLYRFLRGEKVVRLPTLHHALDGFTAMNNAKDKPMPETPTQSREALKQQRTLFTLLEEHYVEDTSRYAPGWDDARIAKETKLALDHVVATREAGFGPIGDPVLDALEARVAAVEAKIIAERDEFARLLTATLGDLNDELQACKKALHAHGRK